MSSTAREKSKVIVITGASSGFGRQAAADLIAKGHIVYSLARRLAPMQELYSTESCGRAIAVDVSVQAEVEEAIHEIISEQGRVDVLVNNAGFGTFSPVEGTSLADVRRIFEVNYGASSTSTRPSCPICASAIVGGLSTSAQLQGVSACRFLAGILVLSSPLRPSRQP